LGEKMLEFKINNDKWIIEEKSKEELEELYQKETEEKIYFVFGVTIKPQHVIYINKDMCEEQKIKTLKHELTHCYIWEYGLFNVIDVNEEVICDLVACSNDFINEVVEKYKNRKE
jgi:Zn-dependent peptidase ImmA (M78 family)